MPFFEKYGIGSIEHRSGSDRGFRFILGDRGKMIPHVVYRSILTVVLALGCLCESGIKDIGRVEG